MKADNDLQQKVTEKFAWDRSVSAKHDGVTAEEEMVKHSDLEIVESAIHALRLNPVIPVDRVKITVDKGWLTLEGNLDWQYQRSGVEGALKTLRGIRGITNKVHVKPASRITHVRAKIQSELVRNAQIDANNITIDIDGETATLSGQVRSWAEKEQAEMATWVAPGITQVKNNISVEFYK